MKKSLKKDLFVLNEGDIVRSTVDHCDCDFCSERTLFYAYKGFFGSSLERLPLVVLDDVMQGKPHPRKGQFTSLQVEIVQSAGIVGEGEW